jgi:molecular chaperone HtpG
MDDAEQFLPLYLRFIKGVVDSSDLPLNVSREMLQQNPELAAMRGALTKRALDMLSKLAVDSPEDYATFWREFGQTLKEGIVEDHANKDKLARLLRFATTHTGKQEQDQSLDDYIGRAAEGQDKIYYVLAESHATAAASPHIERLAEQGIEVLLLFDRIDGWVVDALGKYADKPLQDVARDGIELPSGEGKISQETLNEEHKPLLKKLKKTLKDRVEAVQISQRLVDSPACVVAAEHELNPQIRRMLEASGQALPESKPILEINIGHPLVNRLSAQEDGDRFDSLANILLDHALLAEGTQLDHPAAYVKRMNALLLELDSGAGTG